MSGTHDGPRGKGAPGEFVVPMYAMASFPAPPTMSWALAASFTSAGETMSGGHATRPSGCYRSD